MSQQQQQPSSKILQTIVEKWFFLEWQHIAWHTPVDLVLEFFKPVLINRALSAIFLQLLADRYIPFLGNYGDEVNFNVSFYKTLDRRPNHSGPDSFTTSDWFFFYVLSRDVRFSCDLGNPVKNMQYQKQCHSFPGDETSVQSVVKLFMDRNPQQIPEVLALIEEAQLDVEEQELSIHEPVFSPLFKYANWEVVERALNCNAKELTFLVWACEYATIQPMNLPFVRSSVKAVRTRKFLMMVDKGIQGCWKTGEWRMILAYAIDACPNLEEITLELNPSFPWPDDTPAIKEAWQKLVPHITWIIEWASTELIPILHDNLKKLAIRYQNLYVIDEEQKAQMKSDVESLVKKAGNFVEKKNIQDSEEALQFSVVSTLDPRMTFQW